MLAALWLYWVGLFCGACSSSTNSLVCNDCHCGERDWSFFFIICIYITIILSLKCHSHKHKLQIVKCFTLSEEHVSMKIIATFETNTFIESLVKQVRKRSQENGQPVLPNLEDCIVHDHFCYGEGHLCFAIKVSFVFTTMGRLVWVYIPYTFRLFSWMQTDIHGGFVKMF